MPAKRHKSIALESCTRCPLHRTRRKVVWGRGTSPADLLFLGEAPGRVEDLRGQPFVGPSGQLLDEMIREAAARIQIDIPTYFITNCVMCHPTERKGGDNRPPTSSEVVACMDNVMQIYRQVRPEIVVFVGRVPERYYAKEFPIHETILHPAYLLRQGGKASSHYLTTVRRLEDIFMEVTDAEA